MGMETFGLFVIKFLLKVGGPGLLTVQDQSDDLLSVPGGVRVRVSQMTRNNIKCSHCNTDLPGHRKDLRLTGLLICHNYIYT